jgi:hypothetical protein
VSTRERERAAVEEENREAKPAPATATPADQIKRLQAGAGNAAVARMLSRAPLARKQDEALNLTPPVAGQDPLDLKQQNAVRFINNELGAVEVKTIKKQVLTDRMAQAVAATGQVVPEATKNAVLTAFKAQVDTAAPDDSFAAYLGTWNDPSTQAPQFAKALINTLFNELKAQFVPAVRNKYKRLDREIDQRLQRVDKIEQLPDQSKAAFAAALRGMPGFGAMVRKIKGDNKVEVTPTIGGGKQPEWSGGGSLADMVTEVDGPGALLETDLRDGTFAKKVKEVDAFYKTLLEADVLGEIKKPKIMVHKCMSADKAWAEQAQGNPVPNGFGGYQAGGEVHVGQDVFREILTHEVGHHIENNLPRERWQDIQLFMRARHNAAGGTGKLQPGQSPRLAGTYAATGPYTSTTYNDDVGGTEFTAMTVQYLSDKKDLDTMLDSDPAQVAVLVRALRPKEYGSHAALRAYDKYLPAP